MFSLCNPGRASDTNILTNNPRRWEKKFNESFGRPLDEKIDQLTKPAQGDTSPDPRNSDRHHKSRGVE